MCALIAKPPQMRGRFSGCWSACRGRVPADIVHQASPHSLLPSGVKSPTGASRWGFCFLCFRKSGETAPRSGGGSPAQSWKLESRNSRGGGGFLRFARWNLSHTTPIGSGLGAGSGSGSGIGLLFRWIFFRALTRPVLCSTTRWASRTQSGHGVCPCPQVSECVCFSIPVL